MTPRARRLALHGSAIALATLPLAVLGVRALTDGLGANPIEELTHETGEWSLRCLLLALAVTPARRWLGWAWAAPLRRTLGLLAFGWVCLHFTVWIGLDQFFDWTAMREDVLERRFITVGFLGLLCLAPLALTSTRAWMRRLGRRWQLLHRLAYAAGVCGVVHYVWLVKGDRIEPLYYAGALVLLLGARLMPRRRSDPRRPLGTARRRRAAAPAAPAAPGSGAPPGSAPRSP
jgi:sulfoxide reductase heme-binding subunit YedZ